MTEKRFRLYTLDHDGYNLWGALPDFADAVQKAVEIASRGNWTYNREVRIKLDEEAILDVHMDGARKLLNHYENQSIAPVASTTAQP